MSEKFVKFFAVLAGLQFLLVVFLFVSVKNDPAMHAVFGMALGLFVLWLIFCGLLMKKFKDFIRAFVQNIPGDWRLKFVVFAIILALIEEAITTAMTNTAPFYGVSPVLAHITASTNYWDVVFSHSVILFAPMFCVWAWLLSRYDFSPTQVFLLWGLSGYFVEIVYSGPSHFAEIGGWVLIYGLMLYLPAYCIPADRQAKKPKWWTHFFAIFGVPIIGVIIGGILGTVIKYFRPPHFFPGIK